MAARMRGRKKRGLNLEKTRNISSAVRVELEGQAMGRMVQIDAAPFNNHVRQETSPYATHECDRRMNRMGRLQHLLHMGDRRHGHGPEAVAEDADDPVFQAVDPLLVGLASQVPGLLALRTKGHIHPAGGGEIDTRAMRGRTQGIGTLLTSGVVSRTSMVRKRA